MPTALDRIFEAAGCRTQVELAEFLGIRQSSISDAKKRGAIPAEWLIKLLRENQINPDWILTGEGPRVLQPAEYVEAVKPLVVHSVEIRPPEQCSTEELLTEIVRRALQNIH